jgi:hypothetical protein
VHIIVEWQEPIRLTHHKKLLIKANALPAEIQDVPGVYFFSRKHDEKYEPFYIGESLQLRRRLEQHLKGNPKLAFVLRGIEDGNEDSIKIKGGERYFHFGYFKAGRGQRAKTCIGIVQKHLLRDALAKKATLLNEKLTTVKTHTIEFAGSVKARAIYDKEGIIEV